MGRRLAMHLLLALSLVASGLASAVHVAAHPVSGIAGLAGPAVERHEGHVHHAPEAPEHDEASCLGYHLYSGSLGGIAVPPAVSCGLAAGAPAGGAVRAGVPTGGPFRAAIRGPPRVS